MTSSPSLMPTGIPGLDQILEGGIVRGNSLLMEGPPGSGKSTLGVRILYEGIVKYGEPGLLVTFEEFPRQVYAEAANYGIDLQALEDAGRLRVIWTPPGRILESFRGKSDLVERIVSEMGVRRLLIDSITHFKRVFTDEARLRDILASILTNLKLAGVNALLVKELERQDEETIAFEEYLVDASLRLHNRTLGNRGENTRFIEIRKTRGHGHVSGLHPFQLDTDGFEIFPRLRLQDVREILPPPSPTTVTDAASPRERVSFGVEGLDQMLEGGLLPGSQSLISGYAGCGKSVVSYHFVNQGLKDGGQAVFLTLKGSAESILGAAASLGMDWRSAFESGRLRIMHFHPLGLSVEKVLDQLIHEVCRLHPRRFVCDSIDSLAHVAGDPEVLRQNVVVMGSILRTIEATSLFLHEARSMGGESEPGQVWLAHLADCSIKLSMAEVEGTLRRFVSVVKHAGSDHVKELREIHIDGSGLRVEREASGLSGVMTGQAQRALHQLSNDVLPTLSGVDGALQRIGASESMGDDLRHEVREARRRLALIDAQLREYFGGVDLAEQNPAPALTVLRPSRRETARILLAEDNPTNQQVALRIIKALGWQVDVVGNGAEAIAALEGTPYDLVLMDVQMPVMDGFEAVGRIRRGETSVRNGSVPIIAMTAHTMQGARERCLEAGMNDYVTKPVSPRTLAAVLERWLPSRPDERYPENRRPRDDAERKAA